MGREIQRTLEEPEPAGRRVSGEEEEESEEEGEEEDEGGEDNRALARTQSLRAMIDALFARDSSIRAEVWCLESSYRSLPARLSVSRSQGRT